MKRNEEKRSRTSRKKNSDPMKKSVQFSIFFGSTWTKITKQATFRGQHRYLPSKSGPCRSNTLTFEIQVHTAQEGFWPWRRNAIPLLGPCQRSATEHSRTDMGVPGVGAQLTQSIGQKGPTHAAPAELRTMIRNRRGEKN